MAVLVAVAGLPGSGKTHYVRTQGEKFGYHVASDVTQNEWATWPSVVEALVAGKNAIIDSAGFIAEDGQKALRKRVAEIPTNVIIEWRYFEMNPDACLRNILRDVFLRPKREFEGRMKTFLYRAKHYKVPEGATILPVYSPAEYVELPLGKFTVHWLPE